MYIPASLIFIGILFVFRMEFPPHNKSLTIDDKLCVKTIISWLREVKRQCEGALHFAAWV